jgi:molybdopterin synthase sulfur carrier subunit
VRGIIWIPENLRRFCAGRERLDVEGSTVGDALADCAKQYPQLAERVMDEEGRLRRHLVMLRDDEVLSRDGLPELPLRDGDELRLFGAASGG